MYGAGVVVVIVVIVIVIVVIVIVVIIVVVIVVVVIVVIIKVALKGWGRVSKEKGRKFKSQIPHQNKSMGTSTRTHTSLSHHAYMLSHLILLHPPCQHAGVVMAPMASKPETDFPSGNPGLSDPDPGDTLSIESCDAVDSLVLGKLYSLTARYGRDVA